MQVYVSPAQTRREDEPYCDEKSAKKVGITNADATILGLAIGRASLKDVQAKLGSANVTRVSREEESDVSICYVSPADGTVLVFYSGVMGGGKDITWFALWSREAAFPHTSQCTPSKLVSRSLGTQSGLRLGLTKADLERIVGKPTERGPGELKGRVQSKLPQERSGWVRLSGISLCSKRLVSIKLLRVGRWMPCQTGASVAATRMNAQGEQPIITCPAQNSLAAKRVITFCSVYTSFRRAW